MVRLMEKPREISFRDMYLGLSLSRLYEELNLLSEHVKPSSRRPHPSEWPARRLALYQLIVEQKRAD